MSLFRSAAAFLRSATTAINVAAAAAPSSGQVLTATSSTTATWQDAAGGGTVGSVVMWVTGSAPTGYLLCNGAAVSRATYSALYAVIGDVYGAGDGTTTFNVPNFQGKVAVGYSSGETEFDALAETGGAKTHTLTLAEAPAHSHGPSSGGSFHKHGGGNHGGTSSNSASDVALTDSQGGGGAHNNLQPYLVVNFIIKT